MVVIDNPEAFKAWLQKTVKPLCQADPIALAKYVYALVKKNQPNLKEILLEQLDIFLHQNTTEFVNVLFDTLDTKSYLTVVNDNETVETPNNSTTTTTTTTTVASAVVKSEPEAVKRKAEVDKDEGPPVRRRHRSPLSPIRARSRSWEGRRRNSRSPRRVRQMRNKSPPRRRDRNRSRSPLRRSKSPVRRSRSRSRSPRHRRYSRSRSPPPREKKSPVSGGDTPTQDSNHGDVDMRLATKTQSIQSVVVTDPKSFKRRCRDFDEKGYCMLGETCPYDHGNDPLVLENTGNGIHFPPQLAPPLASTVVPPPPILPHLTQNPPPEYNPEVATMGRGWFRPTGFRGRGGRGKPMQLPPYMPPQRELISVPVTDDASEANISSSVEQTQPKGIQPNFDFNRLGPRAFNCSLELKKVPRGLNNITHLNNHFSRFGKIVNIQVSYEGDPEAALVTFSSHAEANAAYKSTEAVLNNRFIKVFWHTKDKQENVAPPGSMRLNIKDRLGFKNKKVINNAPQGETSNNNTEPEQPEQEEKVLVSGNTITKTVFMPNALKKPVDPAVQQTNRALAAAAIKKNQELLAATTLLKKKQQEQKQEAIKLSANLKKRKQDLLDMQLKQQKLLIDKLEKGKSTIPASEQKELMTTIKSLYESIQTLRKELVPGPKKSKDETLKEILDAELDLFNRQHEGKDSTELKQKVAELKLEAQKLGIYGPTSSGRGRGRGFRGWRGGRGSLLSAGRGRGSPRIAHNVVDHRPTRLLISGHESDECQQVIAHFAQFGEIAEYTTDDQLPSLDIKFKNRKDAENALLQGKHFKDRVLSVTWSHSISLITEKSNNEHNDTINTEDDDAANNQDLEQEIDDIDLNDTELNYEEDEEYAEDEDDNEDRSWRR